MPTSRAGRRRRPTGLLLIVLPLLGSGRRRRPAGLLPVLLSLLWAGPLAGLEPTSYPFVVQAVIWAPDNAAKTQHLRLFGSADVAADGSVSGEAWSVFHYLEPCGWEPPYPHSGPPPYCGLRGVTDGTYTVSGKVLESVNTTTDSPLAKAVAGYLGAMGIERNIAASKLELTISPVQVPNEHMDLWGWEDPMETKRISTGAAFLGLGGAKVLLEPFTVVPALPGVAGAGPDLGIVPFGGIFRQGVTLVFGSGKLGFLVSLEGLPRSTSPAVAVSSLAPQAPAEPPPGPSAEELQEIRELAVWASQFQEQPAEGWADAWKDLVDNLPGSGDGSTGGLTGTGLLDDTRPENEGGGGR